MDASTRSLAERIDALCRLKGNFTLRSGRTSTEYFDKYRFESVPDLLFEITRRMVDLIPTGTEVLAGLEMGGIPVVTMLSYHSGLPAAFVRKAAKAYGTSRLSEGAGISGKKVLVIEDVVTSGGQIVVSVGELRQLGATIDHSLCVIDREEGGAETLLQNGITLLSLFKKRDFAKP